MILLLTACPLPNLFNSGVIPFSTACPLPNLFTPGLISYPPFSSQLVQFRRSIFWATLEESTNFSVGEICAVTKSPTAPNTSDDCSPKISPRGLFLRRPLQHLLGVIFGDRSSMAVPFRWNASVKLSADICMPGNGDWTLWDFVLGGRSRARARLASGRGWSIRKSVRTNRTRATDLQS